ncbi:MAG TPA: MobF family relaxase [Marmoricola sp.]|nr:MobF family relaxase [Marmoricola sp.]
MRFYHGSAKAARCYLEADRSRVDDYYLAEGTGLATHYVAAPSGAAADGGTAGQLGAGLPRVRVEGVLDGPAYERWVAGYTATGQAKGRLRKDADGIRFFEVLVNGPKTWSLAAALHPDVAAAYDAAQERAAREIVGWLAEHSTTRVGPRGRQVQVPVEELEAAVIRHYSSRAGDPHRHLHLQVNARIFAAGGWRGLHSRGLVDSLEAIHGIGHAAVACDPQFRQVLAAHGYTLDVETAEVRELAPYAGAFSARAAQIGRNLDRYEAEWRTEHPGQEPGARLRRSWDQRAWAQARPGKVVPTDGHELERRWVTELAELGFTPPTRPDQLPAVPAVLPVGRLDRDAVVDLVLCRLGARRSGWNSADIRGQVEKIIALAGIVTDPAVRAELAEDLTARTVARCVRLLDRAQVPDDRVPEHVRSFTSTRVLAVEKDLVARLTARAEQPATRVRVGEIVARRRLDPAQRQVVAALAGTGRLLVIEGAAGTGKTTTLAAAAELLAMSQQRLVVVTPTLKAARVAAREVGADAFSAAWLVHQHGYRWDTDGHWTRQPVERDELDPGARLLPGDVLLCDEAGMLDQDTARALLTVADEIGARVAFLGDRHQLPAVGRGGVLDLAARWTPPEAHLELEAVHRFTDPDYAQLSLLMRTGQHPGQVFDALLARGQIVVHATEVERLHALTHQGPSDRSSRDRAGRAGDRGLILADTRDQVAALNAAIRDQRQANGDARTGQVVATGRGEQIGVGDRVATRRNDRDLAVANRDTWTVSAVHDDGALDLEGRNGHRRLPAGYVAEHVELAYATTIYGAQGETVQTAHLLIGETTGAAAAYVGMTRGRQHNTAHLVADSPAEARRQWIAVFGRDRADLGPAHAAHLAAEDIATYGPTAPTRGRRPHRPHRPRRPLEPPEPYRPPSPGGGRGIGF